MGTSLLGRWGAAAWLVALCLGGSIAAAHTRSQSHSVWEINGSNIDLVMTIPNIEADRLGSGSGSPSDDEVMRYLIPRVYPLASGKPCDLVPPVQPLAATPGFRKFDFTFKCAAAGELTIHSGAFFDLVPSHTNFAQIQNGDTGEFVERLINDEHQDIEVTGGAENHLKSARFFEFIRMGTMHIFTGVDHMSFLLGLVLISRRLRDLVFVVTGFTVGHSLTLALAVTGVLRPHAEYIDALVALTIALIGAENIVVQTGRSRLIALCVGGGLALMAGLQHPGMGRPAEFVIAGSGSLHRELSDVRRPGARCGPRAHGHHPGLRADSWLWFLPRICSSSNCRPNASPNSWWVSIWVSRPGS